MHTDQSWVADIRLTRYIGDKAFERRLDLKAEQQSKADDTGS